MPKKPNYQFEKRQKELDRKTRKEEKLRRRQERVTDAEGAESPSEEPARDGDADDQPRVTPAPAPR